MTRKETTRLLTDILITDRMADRKYYAREVTLDYGTTHSKRIDVVQFSPKGVVFASDIEKGTFTCYEIKSCKEDLYSGHGLNFYGEKNYIVTTMQTYKDIQGDIRDGSLKKYIREHYPESSLNFGFIVPVPSGLDLRKNNEVYAEYQNPTPFSGDIYWKMHTIIPCTEGRRMRSTTELLFCMLRSKHSWTNIVDESEEQA